MYGGDYRNLQPLTHEEVERWHRHHASSPLSWIVEGCVAWWLTGGWGLALFTVSLIPTGFFALTWQERLGRFGREARGFFQFLGNRDLRRRLLARRRALLDHLAALAQEVPPSVLKGAVPET